MFIFQTKTWYEHRYAEREADTITPDGPSGGDTDTKCGSSSSVPVPVAFDESDGTVIVVDRMDIYKVPRESISTMEAAATAPEERVAQETDDPKGEVAKEAGSSSDEFDRCEVSSSSSLEEGTVEGKKEKFLRGRSASATATNRYVDQSASLLSLRSTAAVSGAIARFDAMASSSASSVAAPQDASKEDVRPSRDNQVEE